MVRRSIVLLWFAALLGTAGAQVEPRPVILSLNQFQQQLDQLNVQVDDLAAHPEKAEALRKTLPKKWTLIGGRLPVDVETSSLDQALTDFQKEGPEQKKTTLRELHTQFAALRTEVDRFRQPEMVNDATRKRLDDILAAREFASVQGPSWLEIVLDRIRDWIDRWLAKANITPPDLSWVGRIFIWLLVAAAVSVLAVWLFRIYRRRPAEVVREIIPFAPSARGWRSWLADARAKAERGEWREAIHLSYWAGVSYLEAAGVWVPDRARTPREYLKEVDASDPRKATFIALTRRFENVWYGSRRAHADDFDAALTELEQLGCR